MGALSTVPWRQVVVGCAGAEEGAAMSDVLTKRIRTIMHLTDKVWKPRNKLEGEAPPVTFSHLKDKQIYKTDWVTPVRPGATDHLNAKSKGDGV